MHKSRLVLICIALLLSLALLITLVGCKGTETATTPTPTGTATGATTTPTTTPTATKTTTATSTPTPTPSSTSPSGQTLSGIYGVGKNLRDVQFDQVMTAPGQPQMTAKVWWKDWPSNTMKYRSEMTAEGTTTIDLVLYGPKTMYMWTQGQNTVYQMNFGQASKNPTENSDQIKPTYLGTETVDVKLCDKWQYTTSDSTTTVWIWKAESFPIKQESTTSSGTVTVEYKNIVFGTIPDSTFELPAGAQVTQFPSYTP